MLWGFNNPTTLLKNNQPELQLIFPVSYGNKHKEYYYGHGKYGNRLELDMMGTVETHADAYGMMILPSKDTLHHVLRTHTIKYIAEDTQPITPWYREKHQNPPTLTNDSIDYRLNTDSVVFVVETYRWYQKGYRYPIFETVRSWEQHRNTTDYEFLNTAFYYPPQDHYYLEDDEDNLALLNEDEESEGNEHNVDPWAGLTYNIFPNPVKTDLEIELYLPKQVGNICIQVRNTMGTIELEHRYGSYTEGTCYFNINVSNLLVNNYILDIWLDDKLINEIIMKR